MPVGHIPITIGASTLQGEANQRVESGILEAVSLHPEQTGLGVAQAFGILDLISYENPAPVRAAFLTSGYIGASQPLSWTGHIILEPQFAVRALVFCTVATIPFTLSILTNTRFPRAGE